MLSIVIPVLNDADRLADVLGRLADAPVDKEILVADGGSGDASPDIAVQAGAHVVTAPRGRGAQMAAGADAAVGDWLLFLHADTRLGPGWTTVASRFMADPENRFRAAYFTFALDDPSPAARRLEMAVAWRCRHLSLPYGDQGLLIGREFYDRLGGFKPIPIMEDVELVRVISGHRLENLPVMAVTSAERYRRDGYLLRPLRNLICLGLHFLGVPPAYLKRLYG